MHIRKMLEELTKHVTCIIVSHRLSSVIKADRIIAIEEGQIVEQGSHAELLKRDGYYARLYYEQTRGVKLGIIK
jgi:ATP-binding cassette subfamily B protein